MSRPERRRHHPSRRCIWTTERPHARFKDQRTSDQCKTHVSSAEAEAYGAPVCHEHRPAYEAAQKALAQKLEDARRALRRKYDPGCLADQ